MSAWCPFAQKLPWRPGVTPGKLRRRRNSRPSSPHLLDVAGLVLNLVVERIRPLVIDPTRPRAIGDVDHFADQVFAVLILQVEKILADQCLPRAMRDAIAFQVVNEWIEITIMEVRHRLIGNRFEGWFG